MTEVESCELEITKSQQESRVLQAKLNYVVQRTRASSSDQSEQITLQDFQPGFELICQSPLQFLSITLSDVADLPPQDELVKQI